MITMTIADLTARKVALAEQIDRLTQEKKQIDEKLAELGPGKHDAGEWTVTVSPNRRIDTARIEQRFPVAQYPHLYRPAVDTAALKEYMAPIELNAFYIEGQPRILVK
ncbi:hypothetical protein [Microbacterium sp.]|uniref:hypothetical protein n=1 Tax=Microbacterium sp. TaxID=51671 RepID=UPI0039E5452D